MEPAAQQSATSIDNLNPLSNEDMNDLTGKTLGDYFLLRK